MGLHLSQKRPPPPNPLPQGEGEKVLLHAALGRDSRVVETRWDGIGTWPSGSIFVVQAHPVHGAGGLVAALGGEIEPVERAHQ